MTAIATTKTQKHERASRSSRLRDFMVNARSGVVLLPLFLAMACSQKADEPSAQSRGAANQNALRPIAMPDVSGAAPPVQTQLRERFASTTAAIERVGASASERAEAYGELGKLFVAAEFLDAAEPCFSNAALLKPDEMRWPYYLGHVYRLKNDPERAAALFSESLRLRPDDVPSLVWLGEMELTRDRQDEAKSHWTRALTLQPKTAAALYGLGRVALAQEDYAQAVKYLEDALTLAPQASRIQYPLAMAYRALGNRTQAESHLRLRGEVDVTPPDPLLAGLRDLLQNAQAYEIRGSEALTRRDWSAAVTNLRKAVELQPENALTRLNLGTALYLKGQLHPGDSVIARDWSEQSLRYYLLTAGVPLTYVNASNPQRTFAVVNDITADKLPDVLASANMSSKTESQARFLVKYDSASLYEIRSMAVPSDP